MRSAAAMLDDAGRGVTRRADRGEGDEQSVRLAFPALEKAAVLRADHLRGAGLSRHLHVGDSQRRAHRRPARLIDDGNHAGADEFEMRRIDIEQSRLRRIVGLGDQVGRDGPARGDARRHDRELKRRGGDIALADAAADGLAGVPRLPQSLLLPGRVGNDGLLLAHQAEVVNLTEAERPRRGGETIDAEPICRLIEIDVARLLDRLMHVDAGTVSLPAAEAMATEHVGARARHVLVGRDDAGFKPGQSGHHLEGRARRIDAAQRAILQGMILVSGELLPSVQIHPEGHVVGIERGIRGQHQNRARHRVEHDDGGDTQALDPLQRDRLQILIDGESHVLATHARQDWLPIDQELQAIALNRIEGLRIASIVVLDAVTGAILVLASYPTFDPNDMSFRVNLDRWKELARNKDHPLENRALRGVYPPGSTFKVVTALAGLEAGVITADEHMTCPGAYMFGRHRFRCWKRHGPGIDVHQAIKQSCDVYFYETANRLGIDRLAATARALGLGQIHDLGLVGQKQAIIPDTAWKKKALRQPWYPGETISCGIGQGYVSATPLQLAVVAARIATGRAVSPHLIAKSDNAPEPALLNVDPVHLELVRAGMVAVVNEPGGTAVRSALAIPDVQMAGKTGTSQVISAKNRGFLKGWEGETHALFIAFAPVGAPRYAAACVVEHGGGGSHAAAPVVKDVMTEILLRDPAARPGFFASNQPANSPALAAAELPE